jgi:hypothetical protein
MQKLHVLNMSDLQRCKKDAGTFRVVSLRFTLSTKTNGGGFVMLNPVFLEVRSCIHRCRLHQLLKNASPVYNKTSPVYHPCL